MIKRVKREKKTFSVYQQTACGVSVLARFLYVLFLPFSLGLSDCSESEYPTLFHGRECLSTLFPSGPYCITLSFSPFLESVKREKGLNCSILTLRFELNGKSLFSWGKNARALYCALSHLIFLRENKNHHVGQWTTTGGSEVSHQGWEILWRLEQGKPRTPFPSPLHSFYRSISLHISLTRSNNQSLLWEKEIGRILSLGINSG